MAAKRGRQTRKRGKAATADVVGRPRRNERIPPRWKEHFAHLIELRDHLLLHQGDLVKEAGEEQPAFSLHMADAATDSFDRDLALSWISSEQDAVYEIDQALNRIRDGTYGLCELTGKPIERRRLAAIPWTRFSAAVEKELERQGAVRHPRLAPRVPVPRSLKSEEEGEEPTDDDASPQE